ncbi:MAG: hypothetical protein AAF329_18895 [Cyanobacteria bacterium P01_A01_bin.17]
MPLLSAAEYTVEALRADVALQRSAANLLELQLVTLSEGLELSQNPALTTGDASVNQHTCAAFETLPIISTRYYGSPDNWPAIAEFNDLDYPYTVIPGQILKIPPSG